MTKPIKTLLRALLAIPILGSIGGAQSVLTGKVIADRDLFPPMDGAEIAIPGLNLATRADTSGRFLISGIPRGSYRVIVRRVGYNATGIDRHFSGTDTVALDFALTPIATKLDTVQVEGIARQRGKFLEFEDRRSHGGGAFLTRADLERDKDRPLGEIVAKLPGIRVNRYGAESSIASSRWSSTSARSGDSMDRRKGAPRACYSQVYVDNVRVFSSAPGEALFNINSVPPSTIQGIEYYASRDETPIQYATSRADCGTMLIWTRIE